MTAWEAMLDMETFKKASTACLRRKTTALLKGEDDIQHCLREREDDSLKGKTTAVIKRENDSLGRKVRTCNGNTTPGL